MCNNDNCNNCEKINETFEYGKTYYFDKSGISINECELETLNIDCIPIIKSCCRLQLPKGFKFHKDCPGMCFDLSNLSCIKNPITQKVILPTGECDHPIECEPVVGYEIVAIGDVYFSISAPLCPINGYCFPIHSHTCCSSSTPVKKVISYSCCPKPCPENIPCVDCHFAFFCIKKKTDNCGDYLEVTMGVALEYTGSCECDEE